MPECKYFRDKEIRNTKRKKRRDGTVVIRITFNGPKGVTGEQIEVSPDEYDAGVRRSFVKGKGK